MPNYEFTIEEVKALYRLIWKMGWIPRDDQDITNVIEHITEIVRANDMASNKE